MKKKIEIYVRNSGNRNLLMLHVPDGMKERLIEGIRNGSFETQDARRSSRGASDVKFHSKHHRASLTWR